MYLHWYGQIIQSLQRQSRVKGKTYWWNKKLLSSVEKQPDNIITKIASFSSREIYCD